MCRYKVRYLTSAKDAFQFEVEKEFESRAVAVLFIRKLISTLMYEQITLITIDNNVTKEEEGLFVVGYEDGKSVIEYDDAWKN